MTSHSNHKYEFPSKHAASSKPILKKVLSSNFYRRPYQAWFTELCNDLFKIESRQTTITAEIYYGLIHFISCFYCLAVIPPIMSTAGYQMGPLFLTTSLCCGIGSILGGIVTNLPFPFAPPTVVTIFLSSYLREYAPKEMIYSTGSLVVIISGFLIMLLGYRPLLHFIGFLIPSSIQVGTSIGIGLLTALAGAAEIELVKKGPDGTLLMMGHVSIDVIISLFGVALICILTHYHINGPFALTILICSVLAWICNHSWPTSIISLDSYLIQYQPSYTTTINPSQVIILTLDLLVLYILYLAGLTSSLSRLAELVREDGTVPRSRWIYVLVGLMTILSGYFSGVPILLSPEGAAAIKEGAKTGLSSVICGILFLLASFFSPIFQSIPTAGTAPILIMVGALLFQNVSRIEWKSITQSAPAFIVLFFIPFTFSLIQGVFIGYIIYIVINIATGDMWYDILDLIEIYIPSIYIKLFPESHEDYIQLNDDNDTPNNSNTSPKFNVTYDTPESIDSTISNKSHIIKLFNTYQNQDQYMQDNTKTNMTTTIHVLNLNADGIEDQKEDDISMKIQSTDSSIQLKVESSCKMSTESITVPVKSPHRRMSALRLNYSDTLYNANNTNYTDDTENNNTNMDNHYIMGYHELDLPSPRSTTRRSSVRNSIT